jgi:hypothetical protein
VLGAPLVIDADDFKPASGNSLYDVLSEICREIRKSPLAQPFRAAGTR